MVRRGASAIGGKKQRAGQRIWVGDQLQRMAQIRDTVSPAAGVQLPLSVL